jgi:hypothetical protein
VLKRTIADGVARGLFGYAAKDAQDRFEPLYRPGWHVWS